MSHTESSAEIQREAEAERAKLADTLDRLRENLRPANMVGEVMSGAQIGTHDITDRVWKTARSNPIPSALIGIGAAMLLGIGNTVRTRTAAKGRDWTKEAKLPTSVKSKPPRAVPAPALRRTASIPPVDRSTEQPSPQLSESAARIADSVKRCGLRRSARPTLFHRRHGPASPDRTERTPL